MAMDKRRRSRSICQRFLLIALTVQAMTPDLQDLASPFLFEVLSVLPFAVVPPLEAMEVASSALVDGPSSRDRGDNPSSKLVDQDAMPVEACLPPGRQAPVIVPRSLAGVTRLWSLPPGHLKPTFSIGRKHLPTPHPCILQDIDLTITLCQLNC
jgi:hypothetical protein